MNKNGNTEALASCPTPANTPVAQCRELISALSDQEKRQLLCAIVKELFGPRFAKEVAIWDENEILYAYLLPPGERFRLHLLENPELAEELKRRSQAPGKTRLSDLIQRLREQYP